MTQDRRVQAADTPSALPPSSAAHTASAAPLVSLGALAAGLSLSLVAPAIHAQAGAQATEANAPAAQGTADAVRTLPAVSVKARQDAQTPDAKDNYQAVTSNIGKGKQALRDIPQSVTVVTEKLIDDRNLDTLKEVLKNTGGISFLAAEGGEEDIRLRGFSLAQSGDIFADGMRDPAFYDRDTFNYDRVEVLRGSASMLFGRGSTGGVVNQVSKTPFLMDAHEVSATVGRHDYARVTGDFNFKTGEDAAVRLNLMRTKADNNGAGSSIDKEGAAISGRWGIGTKDEFVASLFYLYNDNGINYGLPWIKTAQTTRAESNQVLPGLDPATYYGMDSDYNRGGATLMSFAHTHRFTGNAELRTSVRYGTYKRDQRASPIRLRALNPSNATSCGPANNVTGLYPTVSMFDASTQLCRNTALKIQNMDLLIGQMDFSKKFQALGFKHELLAGWEYAEESREVYAARTQVQGGVNLTKPFITAGQTSGGGWVDESSRVLRLANAYDASVWSAYVQDLVHLAPEWKVLAGLRFDRLDASYDFNAITTAAPIIITPESYKQEFSKLSQRFGLLFQPTPRHSFHVSYGTSFNMSGDAYSYAGAINDPVSRQRAVNTPPESSQNLELGGKLDSESGNLSTRFAVFHSTKLKERNTDATSVGADSYLLSGKRHATGMELDVAGRITSKWEAYLSYMWIPSAKVDESASATFGNRQGDRPGLTPKHSGTVWTTYQIMPKLRVGAGINFRSSQTPADISATNGAWEVPGFQTYDLMAEYNVNQTFTVKANVTNLKNKLYADSLYRGHYVPGAGRLVQFELVAKF